MRSFQKNKGFTLLEVLGGVAVILTLATVSVVSIKDAVSAGQKAAVQRELQSLNTTLQSFTAAGGVIPEGAGVAEALDALKGGVDLTGSKVEFNPLVNLPPMTMSIAGEAYDLSYDPESGFAYASDSGEGLGLSGQGLATAGSGAPANSINDSNVGEFLGRLTTLDSTDPEYAEMLEELGVAVASGDLSQASLDAINQTMLEQGLTYDEESLAWAVVPLPTYPASWPVNPYIFDISDPLAVQAAMATLADLRERSQVSVEFVDPNDPEGPTVYVFNANRWDYAQTIDALLEASKQGHAEFSPEVVQSFVDGELTTMMDAVQAEVITFMTTGWSDPWRWSALMNSLVKVMEVEGYREGPVSDFLYNQLMGPRRNMPQDSVDRVDWSVEGANQATLYQPTGANASLTPLLGRSFLLAEGDTLAQLFGTPETNGIVGGTNVTAQKVLVRNPTGSSNQYYWNASLNRWTRIALFNPNATTTVLAPGSVVSLLPPP